MSKTMSRAFGCPQKYIQGPGELNNLPELLAPYGSKPYIVLDGGVYDFIQPRLEDIFKAGSMDFECLKFTGESCRENIDRVKENAQSMNFIGKGYRSIIADHTINHNPLIHHEPHIVSEQSVKNIIKAADKIGRNYLEGKPFLL